MFRKPILILAMMCVAEIASATDFPAFPFIHATGNAAVFVRPDIGEISFEITASDSDAEKATQQILTLNADILKLADDEQIPIKNVAMFEVQKKMRDVENAGANSNNATVNITQLIQIEVRDMNKWGELTSALLAKNNLTNFFTTFDRTDREKIKDDLMQEAIKDAQHNGTLMAQGFGKQLGAVVAVSEGNLKNVGFAFGVAKGDDYYHEDKNEKRQFADPTMIRIVRNVDVLFKIK